MQLKKSFTLKLSEKRLEKLKAYAEYRDKTITCIVEDLIDNIHKIDQNVAENTYMNMYLKKNKPKPEECNNKITTDIIVHPIKVAIN